MRIRWMLIALLCVALLPAATALPRSTGPAAITQDAPPRDHDDRRDMDHQDMDRHDDHHDMDRRDGHHEPDWDHDRRFEGRNPGYRQGFRDGFGDGRNDREAGRRWHYGLGYKHPDRGFRDEFGNKDQYKREYRQGYEAAYREGYGDRH